MQGAVDRMSKACDNFQLAISTKKTEVVHQPAPGKPNSKPTTTVNGQKLVMIRKRFSLRKIIIKDINFGLVRMYVTPYRFSWTIFILGLALSYTDTLLVFRWVQIVLHL